MKLCLNKIKILPAWIYHQLNHVYRSRTNVLEYLKPERRSRYWHLIAIDKYQVKTNFFRYTPAQKFTTCALDSFNNNRQIGYRAFYENFRLKVPVDPESFSYWCQKWCWRHQLLRHVANWVVGNISKCKSVSRFPSPSTRRRWRESTT